MSRFALSLVQNGPSSAVEGKVNSLGQSGVLSEADVSSLEDEMAHKAVAIEDQDQHNTQSQDESDLEEVLPYTRINMWEVVYKSAINLVLPFINGFMLGWGEILAHEVGFRYQWFGAKVNPPRRMERRRAQSRFL